jgi:hypothetical protein
MPGVFTSSFLTSGSVAAFLATITCEPSGCCPPASCAGSREPPSIRPSGTAASPPSFKSQSRQLAPRSTRGDSRRTSPLSAGASSRSCGGHHHDRQSTVMVNIAAATSMSSTEPGLTHTTLMPTASSCDSICAWSFVGNASSTRDTLD